MWRDGSGFLVCPDEGKGRSSVTLDLLNAGHAGRVRPRYTKDGGNYDDSGDELDPDNHPIQGTF